MAELKNIFDVAARGMSAQMVRLNTVASNLANARSVASSEAEAYRAIKPVFSTLYADDLVDVVSVDKEPEKVYQPGHPKADKDGYIYMAAVNPEEEMVEMLEASRQYENNVEVVSTLRGLMMRTISMGR